MSARAAESEREHLKDLGAALWALERRGAHAELSAENVERLRRSASWRTLLRGRLLISAAQLTGRPQDAARQTLVLMEGALDLIGRPPVVPVGLGRQLTGPFLDGWARNVHEGLKFGSDEIDPAPQARPANHHDRRREILRPCALLTLLAHSDDLWQGPVPRSVSWMEAAGHARLATPLTRYARRWRAMPLEAEDATRLAGTLSAAQGALGLELPPEWLDPQALLELRRGPWAERERQTWG